MEVEKDASVLSAKRVFTSVKRYFVPRAACNVRKEIRKFENEGSLGLIVLLGRRLGSLNGGSLG